jgi:cytochrome c oxidase subunit 4
MNNHDHVVPVSLYVLIFGALLALTATTVWVAFHDFGLFNIVIAMSIAVCKATLVVLYFMHVRWSSRLIWVVVSAGLVWLVILLALTMSDYLTRFADV